MSEETFTSMVAKGKVFCIDVTLREAHETYDDFIERAKRDDLGIWSFKSWLGKK